MEFTYSVSYEEPLIRVRAQGFFDYLKAYEMWKAIVAASDEFKCFHILGESTSTEPIPTLDAYEHLSLIESVGVTRPGHWLDPVEHLGDCPSVGRGIALKGGHTYFIGGPAVAHVV